PSASNSTKWLEGRAQLLGTATANERGKRRAGFQPASSGGAGEIPVIPLALPRSGAGRMPALLCGSWELPGRRSAVQSLLQLLRCLRPIFLEQQRERTVGQQLAVRLAAGTIIRLVVGVSNSLHRRAAKRTRLTELAVDGHLRPERGDVLRKTDAVFVS